MFSLLIPILAVFAHRAGAFQAMSMDKNLWMKIFSMNNKVEDVTHADEKAVELFDALHARGSPLINDKDIIKKADIDRRENRIDARANNKKWEKEASIVMEDLQLHAKQGAFTDLDDSKFTEEFFHEYWQWAYDTYVRKHGLEQQAVEQGIMNFLNVIRNKRSEEFMRKLFEKLAPGAVHQANDNGWDLVPTAPAALKSFFRDVEKRLRKTANRANEVYKISPKAAGETRDVPYHRESDIPVCAHCEEDIKSFRDNQWAQYDALTNPKRRAVADGKLPTGGMPVQADEYGDIAIGDKSWKQNLREDIRNAYLVTYDNHQFVRKVSPDGPDHTGIATLGPELQNLRDLTGHDNMIQFYNFANWAGVAQRERPVDTPELGDFGLMDMEYGLFTLGHDVGILNSDAVKMDGFEGSSRQQGHLLYDYLRGLWWMQRRGLKHCDIKPANLVVVKNPATGNVYGKLIDMGVTVPKEESCFAFTRFYAYQTPTEGYKANAALNLANYDVYALGLSMLYAMGIEAESPEDAGFSFELPAANPEKQSPALYYRGDKLRQRLMEKENYWFANLRCEDPATKQPRFDMARDLMMRFFPEDVFARESERESLLQELLDHECFDDVRVQEIDGQVLKRRGDLVSAVDAEKQLIRTVWTPKQNDPHRRAKFEAWLKRELPVIAPATHVTPIGGNAKINALGRAFMGNNGQAPEANILGRAARVVLPNAAADTFDDIRARYADGGHNDISGEKLGWFLFVGLLLMVLVGLSLERYSRSNLRKII